MIVLPYSTALTLARRPIATYSVALACVLVFVLQVTFGITEKLMYYPDSWNPVKMITAVLAHADLSHLLGNMIFFLAFAPALELLIGSWTRFLGSMLVISVIVGISYSLSVYIGGSADLPTLGFSGVVMGIIGLSAFLMPRARIRVLWWYFIAWKTFFVPAWVVALAYLGLDTFTLLFRSDFAGINIVAHISGGITGYLYGHLRLQQRREETRQELEQEIEAMRVQEKFGKTRSQAFRAAKRQELQQVERQARQDEDRFRRNLYQMVTTHRNSEALLALMKRYDPNNTPTHVLEDLFEHIGTWGPSRTQLCLGRLIINRLDQEKRYGRAIIMMEKCQAISSRFVLPDVSRTLFYANLALEMNKQDVTRNLVIDAEKRYHRLLNARQCHHLLQKSR